VIVENLSLPQLDDISKELMGRLGGAEILKEDGFFQEEEVFIQLEGLNSKELDLVYDALKSRYFKSSTSLSIPPWARRENIMVREGMA
jgi:hypothetical protein